jgi:hypothetical protein
VLKGAKRAESGGLKGRSVLKAAWRSRAAC